MGVFEIGLEGEQEARSRKTKTAGKPDGLDKSRYLDGQCLISKPRPWLG